jgi:hypothetical protein
MSVGLNSRNNYSVIMRNVDAAGRSLEHDYLDIRPSLVQTAHPDNTEYVPSPGDNWSRIAWKKLGNGRHYWIIADYSSIVDPLSELQPETKTRYVAQLALAAHSGDVQITVTSTRKIRRGMLLRIQDLAPLGGTLEGSVLGVDTTNNVVTFSAPLPAAPPMLILPQLSRVSELYQEDVRLVIPSPHRALFEALNFTNAFNTLVA